MGLELRTAMSQCASMRVTAPSGGYTAGQMVKIEDIVGVIVDDIAEGETGAMIYRAEKVVLPKSTVSGQNTFTAGDKIYFDAVDANVNSSSSSNTLCGRALEDAGAAATTVLADLFGMLA